MEYNKMYIQSSYSSSFTKMQKQQSYGYHTTPPTSICGQSQQWSYDCDTTPMYGHSHSQLSSNWQPQSRWSSQSQPQLQWQPTPPQSKFPWVRRIKELINMFRPYDLNGDGRISRAEMACIMRAMGYSASDNEIRRMVGVYDRDGDGTISLSEFIRMNTSNDMLSQRLNDLQTIFSVFDRDKSGCITAEELYEGLRFLGDSSSLDDCYQRIAALDADGDGVVSFQELCVLMGIIHACPCPCA